MKQLNAILLVLVLVCGAVIVAPFVGSEPVRADGPKAGKGEKNGKIADDFFNGPTLSMEITLTNEELERLKRDNRNYAEGTIGGGRCTERGDQAEARRELSGRGRQAGDDAEPGQIQGADRFQGSRNSTSTAAGRHISERDDRRGRWRAAWCRRVAAPTVREAERARPRPVCSERPRKDMISRI